MERWKKKHTAANGKEKGHKVEMVKAEYKE